ncbi:nuclear transport factor 2 family protein [Sphingomonas profundi]|uniref:nuclear transport factor 2 family protein n=1 Tax=Alterirhizorhabdus profundi TaxID=2681549 RepID=UPI0012E8E9EE|nr:nuclear transport factor 2 family protein [Sphingomonas profundi]
MDDGSEFIRILGLYGVAVDFRRWDLFDRIFTGNVSADYSGAVFDGLLAFKVGAAAAWAVFDASQHAMMNPTWTISGDTARSLTYGSWYIERHGLPDGDIWEGRGWYDDRWVRAATGWRIAARRNRVLSSSGNPQVLYGITPTPRSVQVRSPAEAAAAGEVAFLQGDDLVGYAG